MLDTMVNERGLRFQIVRSTDTKTEISCLVVQVIREAQGVPDRIGHCKSHLASAALLLAVAAEETYVSVQTKT